MRKISILSTVVIATVFMMSSCQNYKAKDVTLANLNDSLNYVFGISNGDGIKTYCMQDPTEASINAFIGALDKAYSNSKMYLLGLEVGNFFRYQKEAGLMNDKDLAFNENLVRQGLINGLKQFENDVMTSDEAMTYIQTTMQKIQMERMMMPAESHDHDHKGHNHQH